jgi:hypothetical protein
MKANSRADGTRWYDALIFGLLIPIWIFLGIGDFIVELAWNAYEARVIAERLKSGGLNESK